MTVYQNIAAGKGGNIKNLYSDSTMAISNTIVAGGKAAGSVNDISNDGAITSNDYNIVQALISGNPLKGLTAHNLTGEDPVLGALQDNGGPTPTDADGSSSPGTHTYPTASAAQRELPLISGNIRETLQRWVSVSVAPLRIKLPMSERISPVCRVVLLLSLTCLTALAACSGHGPNGLAVPALRQNKETASKSGAVVRIAIPRRRQRRRGADYVSPATQSIVIVVSSGAGKPKTFNANLTPATNPNCKPVKVVCSIPLLLSPGKYTASFTTYDGLLDHRGQPTGNRLSANQEVPFSMVEGKATVVPVTLGGIPTAVAFIPATSSTLVGGTVSGFSLSRCNASAQTVNVFGVDADGNYIVGSGSPTISLKSSSETLKVASPRPADPTRLRSRRRHRPLCFSRNEHLFNGPSYANDHEWCSSSVASN